MDVNIRMNNKRVNSVNIEFDKTYDIYNRC